MIRAHEEIYYFVLPPWAQFPCKWEDLEKIFKNPFEDGYLDRPEYYLKIGYEAGCEKFQLIKGPVGNGIIKGTGGCRFFWVGFLLRHADFTILPGFSRMGSDYGVRWLGEKNTDEQILGVKKRQPTYLPWISLDHAEDTSNKVYVSLAFGTKAKDEEVGLRFQMRCEFFGLKCQPLSESDTLPAVARRLASPGIYHRWFVLENVADDIGLLIAKAFYLGCAAKWESRTFKFIHLIGEFEGKPAIAQGWSNYRSDESMNTKSQP